MIKKIIIFGFVFTFLFSIVFPTTNVRADSSVVSPALIISEIKVKNSPQGYNEFIELYNNSETIIFLDEYRLAYFNTHTAAGNPTATQSLGNLAIAPKEFFVLSRDITKISGSVQLSLGSGLLDSQGTVRLMGHESAENQDYSKIYDEVKWIDSSVIPVGVHRVSSNDKSLQRVSSQPNLPTFNTQWREDIPTPFSYIYNEQSPPGGNDIGGGPTNPEDDPEVIPESSCEGVVISEILPNPAGADAGKEFIEIHNPTSEAISLQGCGLQFENGPIRYFNLIGFSELEPGQFKAFYDTDTSITLTNGSSDREYKLYLIDSKGSEIYEVKYPGGLGDDAAWALVNGEWQATYMPTPNEANIAMLSKPCPEGQTRNPETNRCVSGGVGGLLKPCNPDQVRNPLTNRCKKVEGSSSLKPCNPDQERNPDTNRCRKIASSNLVPCKPDQFRNPETNRCKKIDGGSNLVPCKPGQERNPETNRCRKVASVNSANTEVEDVYSPALSDGLGWWIAIFAGTGAVGYGLYEWRREILGFLKKFTKST